MNVLSLFDGISCGQLALQRAGIDYEIYYASEINKDSITVTQANFPHTVQLGDIRIMDTTSLPNIEILFAGFPCQSHSRAGRMQKFGDPRGQLFFDAVHVLNQSKPKFFLFENVVMSKDSENLISETLGVRPVMIDSALVSPQRRKRLYWTNIPLISPIEDKGLVIQDIIYDDNYKVFSDPRITRTKKLTKNYVKWDLSGKGYWSQQDRAYFKSSKICTIPKTSPSNKLNIVLDYANDIYRRMHPVEAERCQTLSDYYTDVGLGDAKRIGLVGDGWTVDTITHILKGINA